MILPDIKTAKFGDTPATSVPSENNPIATKNNCRVV